MAKFERARRELRPYVLLVVDHLENLPTEDKRARVREISRDVFGDKIHAVKELIKTYLGQTATSPLAMYLIYNEYFDIAESEALNIKQGEGTMVNLKEHRPDSTGLARGDLSTMSAPPGKKVGPAFADDWIAKTKAQIAKHKADKEEEDIAPLSQMPGLKLKGERPGLR